jgi:hypothetical protein
MQFVCFRPAAEIATDRRAEWIPLAAFMEAN